MLGSPKKSCFGPQARSYKGHVLGISHSLGPLESYTPPIEVQSPPLNEVWKFLSRSPRHFDSYGLYNVRWYKVTRSVDS
ncbi:hypothetical protein TNCV_2484211 [Trichonephila clavipes]|uniref:Uncharacterized protein n=1 Tax=Trichonephila clavipes TaxID=2585209 RepID=A0A8X6VZW2_TRICX|nr:hypothetical protein TNCV_2484211 [Trichonephila clavipes]